MSNDEKRIEKILLCEWISLFVSYLVTSIVCFENYSSVIFQGSAYFRYNDYFRIILCYPPVFLIFSWIVFVIYTKLVGNYIWNSLYSKSFFDLQESDKINFQKESIKDVHRLFSLLNKRFLFTLFALIIVWISMLSTVVIALFPSL